MSLSPPPSRERLPVSTEGGKPYAEMPRTWIKWFTDIKELLAPVSTGGLLIWTAISKAGSNLTDLTIRNHADLQNVNSSTYTHLTELTATDLTDGGNTILHKHTHNIQDGLQGGTTDEYYHNTAHEDALTDIIDTQWSTGVVGTGNLVSDGGSGTINIASSSVLLRATDSDTVDVTQYTVPAITGKALTDLQNNYIYAEYNAGVPRYIATTSQRNDTNTNVLIARVYRNGTSLHINNYAIVRANDNMRRVALRFVETEPTAWASGVMLSGTGTRNIGITAGVLWQCTNKILINAFDSSAAGTFTYAYRDGVGGWTEQTAQTQINNTQYDDGSGTLQTLTANRYAVAWVYIEVDNDVVIQYGQGDYTLAQANAAGAPSVVSPRITAQGLLVGKIVLQKSAATFTSVESAFVSALLTAAVNDHEQLAGLLGGATNDHYHLTGTQHTDLTDGGQSSLHGHPDTLINIQALGAVTDNVTLNDTLAHSWSAGSVLGFALTDNGNGTINLAAGEAMLRPTADEHDDLISCAVAATTNLALTDNSLNYVYVNYNTGTPVVQVGTALTDFNCLDKCLIYTIAREGTTLYWVDVGSQNIDPNRKHRRMLLECEGFRHVKGGCVLSATGTRNIAVSAGSFYYGLAKISHSAFDTSAASTFKYYYRNGAGGWTTSTGNTQINNTQYDDGTGTLATLSNNKFGVHWVYLVLDNPTILAVQFGQGDYANLSDAEASSVPSAPPTLQGVGVLVGRVIIEKSAVAFSDVASAFAEVFVSGVATSHNGLSGIQGGTAGEYYHLTSAEYTGTGTGNMVRATSPTITTPVITGLLDISGASSGQIKFPATQNASADVNTLDDYEEGTFTPTITFATAGDLSIAYSIQVGGYVKIGKFVTETISITTSTFTHTTASGAFRILGSPFTPENVTNEQWRGAASISGYTAATTYTSLSSSLNANSSILNIGGAGSAIALYNLQVADFPTGGTVVVRTTISFFV